MRKLFTALGTISAIFTVLCLIASAFYWFIYKNTLDGSYDMYVRLRGNSIMALVIGLILLAATVVFFVVRNKV